MLSREVAIITSSGKGYYKLVTELKKRGIPFTSLTPGDTIPIYTKVVVTTELTKINHPHTLCYNLKDDPEIVINKAMQLIQGKNRYDQLIFGIDPGKRIGLAVMGDGVIVMTTMLTKVEEIPKIINETIDRIDARKKIVKIGNGAPHYQSAIVKVLDEQLPINVFIKSVEEKGTTKYLKSPLVHRKSAKDISSAIQITMRNGNNINRTKKNA